ncbi:MAG: DUF4132 domain-containing protein, partial [Gemmataceae bacterium]
MAERIFEFIEGTSKKFWAVSQNGTEYTTRWGRIGTDGQSKTKSCKSDAAATIEVNKLIAEKSGKGYSEVGTNSPAVPVPAVAAPAVAGPTAVQASPVAATAKPAKNASPKAATAAADATKEQLTVEVRFELDPIDYFFVTYQPWTVPPRPVEKPKPFDLDKILAPLEKLDADTTYWRGDLDNKPAVMTREEAHFWFSLYTSKSSQWTRSTLQLKIPKLPATGQITYDEILEQLETGEVNRYAWNKFNSILKTLLTPTEFIKLAKHNWKVRTGQNHFSWEDCALKAAWIVENILPYLSDAERQQLKAEVAPIATVANYNMPNFPMDVFHFAGALGLHAECRAIVAGFADKSYNTNSYQGFDNATAAVLMGLGSKEEVLVEGERIGFYPYHPSHSRRWMAHTGAAGTAALLRTFTKGNPNKAEAETIFKPLHRAFHPEFAPLVLQIKLESKATAEAGKWLQNNRGNAAVGLMPTAAGQGKLAEAAIDHLRDLKRAGHTEWLEEHLKEQPAAVQTAVRNRVLEHVEKVYVELGVAELPKELITLFAACKPVKLPGWGPFSKLPPLVVGSGKLPESAVLQLLGAVSAAKVNEPIPDVILAARKYIEPHSRDAFTWKLFELWQGEGMPPKEKWCFLAMGYLGGDAAAIKLTPLVREWPGQSQHARAVLGLEVLKLIGTDTALMQLNGIAQKLKFAGLKAKAQEFMTLIAAARGMTRNELEDRIVPDLELDEKGGRTFDFGPRQFRMIFNNDMDPVLKDAEGKVKGDLPKPGKTDDAVLAAASVAAWKLLKKQLKEVLKIQTPRLEQAMVSGRRWTIQEFEQLLVGHPLMSNLVRRLIWGVFSNTNQLSLTFRISDEQELVDLEDRAIAKITSGRVGI